MSKFVTITHSMVLEFKDGAIVEIPPPDIDKGWIKIKEEEFSWPHRYVDFIEYSDQNIYGGEGFIVWYENAVSMNAITHMDGMLIAKEYGNRTQEKIRVISASMWRLEAGGNYE